MAAATRAATADFWAGVVAALEAAARTAAIATAMGVPDLAPLAAATETTLAFVPLCQPTEPVGDFHARWVATVSRDRNAGLPVARPVAEPIAASHSGRVRMTDETGEVETDLDMVCLSMVAATG